jgi:proton-dependent oligopeptide transporter, POT family
MHDQPIRTVDPSDDTSGFGGHPRGLNTLFFTEMWERFSYYGMRALLILFMTAATTTGGLGFSAAEAARIYGLYTAAVYLSSLPGGWLADRILGMQRAVFLGGIIIAAGHFSMAVPGLTTFYLGLALIVVGTGLLKPNVSAIVGQLYAPGDPRRDGGFSIYYMGINVGAFLSPLVCGTLGQMVGWHVGFAAAGVGMVLGLIQYSLTRHRLGAAGLAPERSATGGSGFSISLSGSLWLLGAGVILSALVLDLQAMQRFGLLAVGSTIFIVSLYVGGGYTAVEKRRGISIYVLFWVAALFWSGFEQAGSSLNLFADRFTANTLLGREFPSTWYQSLNSLFIISLAPLFSVLWIRMGSKQPSSPMKFAYGLYGVGGGFLIMMWAAVLSNGGEHMVSPTWLVLTYLLHTLGELCLSPVGLSAMTKLAPQRIAGQIMGVWFLAAAIGNYMGGEIASYFEQLPLDQLFGAVAGVNIGIGLLVMLAVPLIRRQMGGVN